MDKLIHPNEVLVRCLTEERIFDLSQKGECVAVLSPLYLPCQESLQAFQKAYANQVTLNCTAKGEELYRVEVTSTLPESESRLVLAVFCILQLAALFQTNPKRRLEEGERLAALQILRTSNAPYYLRYLFSKNALKEVSDFERSRPELEAGRYRLQFGHSQQHRYQAIEPYFPSGAHLVDIGCGKAYYLRRLARRYHEATGFEADLPTQQEALKILRQHNLNRVQLQEAFDETQKIPKGAHVLMTEVLEHMPKPRAEALLRRLATQPAARMVFTVPDRDFNPHYFVGPEEFRHWDHHWEPTFAEFSELMQGIFSPDWKLEIKGIGDAADGVHSSILCCATPKRPIADDDAPDWSSAISKLLR